MSSGQHAPRPGFIRRLAGKAEQAFYDLRRRTGIFKTGNAGEKARMGIYVAYLDASWVFEDHLRSMRDLSAGPFNYYVMGNCTTRAERAWFDTTIKRFGFPRPFYPWPRTLPLSHGESLQRMIEATTDEIIVLCDVDAFPIRYGWDNYIVEELVHKDVVSVVVDIPDRAMPVFLHPCFMAFRRKLLVDYGLNVLAGEGNDPAYRITQFLQNCARLTPVHVSALLPTHREIELFERGTNEFFGRCDLIHGFGTTYADLVFHYWFGRCISRREEPLDKFGNVMLSMSEIDRVVSETLGTLRERCARGGK